MIANHNKEKEFLMRLIEEIKTRERNVVVMTGLNWLPCTLN